jgi:hypothetical protein
MKHITTTRRTLWRFPNGETVAKAMKRAGLNANQLSKLVPCSHGAAYAYRDGRRPTPTYRMLLAKALGVEAKP